MFRKLVKQGAGSYTISLPKNWIIENGLDKTEEVSVQESGKNLLISSTNAGKTNKKISLSLGTMNKDEYRSVFASLYRQGYDELNVSFKDKKSILNIQKAVSTIAGVEVFFLSDNQCTIKKIYDSEKTEIKNHVQRIIHNIKTMQEIINNDLIKGTVDSKKEIKEFRDNVLKQRDLVLRIIKKQKMFEDDKFPYYSITLGLWTITRNYYHLYENITKKDKNLVPVLKKISSHVSTIYSSKKVDVETLMKRHEDYRRIYREILKMTEKSPNATFLLPIIQATQLSDGNYFSLYHE